LEFAAMAGILLGAVGLALPENLADGQADAEIVLGQYQVPLVRAVPSKFSYTR